MKIQENDYVTPAAKVVEISAHSIICNSQMNESYEDGDTSGWYGNN